MNRSVKATLGLKAVSMDTAEEVGSVKSIVLDPTADRIEKIQISGRKSKAIFVDWSDIRSFGDDAVMIAQSAEPAEAQTDRDVDVAKGNIELIGARVLDTGGFDRGTVDDAEFDGDSGAIVSITVSSEVVDASRLRSLGTYAAVIDH